MNGIYMLQFQTSLNAFGEGIIIIKDGEVYGGDIGFTYKGILRGEYITLLVTQYNDKIPSTLNMVDDYLIDISFCMESDGNFSFNGCARGFPSNSLEGNAFFLDSLSTAGVISINENLNIT